MADGNVKKLAEAFDKAAQWAATGRDHYGFIFKPAWETAKKLRTAKDNDPDVAKVVSKAFKEMGESKVYLGTIMSNFDTAYKELEKAKAAFEKAAKKK